MADINELIARLDQLADGDHRSVERLASDALHQQQSRIAELEAERDVVLDAAYQRIDAIYRAYDAEMHGFWDEKKFDLFESRRQRTIGLAEAAEAVRKLRSNGAAAPAPSASVSDLDGEKVNG